MKLYYVALSPCGTVRYALQAELALEVRVRERN